MVMSILPKMPKGKEIETIGGVLGKIIDDMKIEDVSFTMSYNTPQYELSIYLNTGTLLYVFNDIRLDENEDVEDVVHVIHVGETEVFVTKNLAELYRQIHITITLSNAYFKTIQ